MTSSWIGLKKRWKLSTDEKRQLIEPDHPRLSINTQCSLLNLHRSTYYYQKQPPISTEDKILMDCIDTIHTEFPCYGIRTMTNQLKRDGYHVNHKRVQRLMRMMGIKAIYRRPNTSKPQPGHEIYPYLLNGITARSPNHIWGTDITYIRACGVWFYLVAILDWYSRYVVSWELSDTLDADFCVANIKHALQIGVPDIHNSDQGSQFTSTEYLTVLKAAEDIRISMDHRGRCFDNIFTERLWRTVKYEEVYLKEYGSFREAKQSLNSYFQKYNERRLHSAIGYQTPAEVYFAS